MVAVEVAVSVDVGLGCIADIADGAGCAGCAGYGLAKLHTAAVEAPSSLVQPDCLLAAHRV